jgi:hypothetical protein
VSFGQGSLHDLQVGLCMARVANKRSPLLRRQIRSRNESSQLFIAESSDEFNPALGYVPQLIKQLIKGLTATRLHLLLILSINERAAFLEGLTSTGETGWIGVVGHQSLSDGEETPFALDDVSEVIIGAPRRSTRVLTRRHRSRSVGCPNTTKRFRNGLHPESKPDDQFLRPVCHIARD